MALETDPLFILIPDEDAEDAAADKLETFIAEALYQAEIWDSPRTSDGITFWRVVERDPARVRLSGRIDEISQVVHTFWLDLEPIDGGEDTW